MLVDDDEIDYFTLARDDYEEIDSKTLKKVNMSNNVLTKTIRDENLI